LFAFYSKNDMVRITDLHQGIVWGTQTEETLRDERLINRFDYDGDYGTVLNRFIVQAVIGYPLTVHGSGRQTRAFINIRDSVRCVELAILNPPEKGERVRIFNQMTEAFALIDLAQMIATLTGAKIAHLPNPRKEPEANGLHVENRSLIELGLRPIKLDHGLLREISEVPKRYAANCDRSKIPCTAKW
jgi:UDP-sulfoquinovose synthase